MSETKQAESGIPDVSAHRELSPAEETALEAGKSRWLPRVFQSYGTPITELMASPLKTGLIFGVPAGLVGAGLGSAIGGAMTNKQHSTPGALLGGLGVGGLAALAASMDREAKNEGLEELMRRMPEGAAKRDLLADPQYQADFLGWDNNKIVATARARYYRPTERFSKRTEDMRDARARYNERNKTSSVNKDNSMSQNEKKADMPSALVGGLGGAAIGGLGGAGVGGLYGLLSGAHQGKNKLRSALRGALGGGLIGGGVGAGAGAGAGLMLPSGFAAATADPDNLFAGPNARLHMLVNPMGVLSAAGAGAVGGAGLGGYLGNAGRKAMLDDKGEDKNKEEDSAEKQERRKAAQALLDNKTMSLNEKLAAYAALLKQAESDIPLPAPLARQSPITPDMLEPATMKVNPFPAGPLGGRFPSRDSARLAESVVESKLPPRPSIDLSTPMAKQPPDFPIIRDGAEKGSPELRDALDELAGKPLTADRAMRQIARQFREENAARLAQKDTADRAARAAKSDRAMSLEGVKQFFGVSKDQQPGASVWSHIAKPFTSSDKKETKPEPKAEPGMFDKLKPYAEKFKPYAPYAAGGAAALGTAALAYHLMNRKKKKKNPEQESEEEYAMPKAANVNWYALTMQKQANPLAATTLPRLLLRGGLTAAAPYARPVAGTAIATGGVYGLGRALFGGRKEAPKVVEPSLMQQLQQQMQQAMNYKYTPHIAAGVGTAGLLGGAAYMGSRAGKEEAKKKKKKPAGNTETRKAASCREFGKQAALDLGNIGMGAGAGAGLGGLAGGLYGALAPGYEEDPMSGRRRRRSRLMAALRGALGGAAVGGVGGAAAGHFGGHLIPEMTDKLDQAKTEATRAYNSVAPRAMRSQSANADMDALSAAGEEPMAPTANAYGNAAYDAAQNSQWVPPRTATPTPPVGMGGATMAPPQGFNQFR